MYQMAYFNRKLRPPELSSETIAGILVLPVFVILIIFWGIKPAFSFIAAVEFLVAVMLFMQFLNTRNFYLLLLTFMLTFIGIFLTLIAIYGVEGNPKLTKGFSILVIGSLGFIIILNYHKKLKWRSRELLELAAMPVDETKNGFTERPYSVGSIKYSPQALNAFSEFLSSNLIAVCIRDSNRLVFSLDNSIDTRTGLKKNYKNDTWVSFNKEGEIMVNISHKDYMKYTDSYSFDQLCDSLGNLFIEFFELFKKGEGKRIIARLNSLNLNSLIE